MRAPRLRLLRPRLRNPWTLPLALISAVALSAMLVIALEGSSTSPAATSSGANGDIVFARGSSLYLVSTGAVVEAGATDPSWSPNGTKLAFVQGGLIKTCTVVAGVCTAVTSSGLTGTEPVWSPDGTKLAYTSATNEIRTATPAGAGDTAVTTGSIDTSPSWSPDGAQLVFTRNGAIAKVASTGGAVTSITTTGVTGSSHPDWAPDDSGIVFESGSPSQIYVVSPLGGTAELVTGGVETSITPAWSPDATSIVFAQTSGTQGIYKVVDSSGTFGAPQLLDAAAGDATPDWQTAAPIAVSPPSITGGVAPQTGQLLNTTSGSWQGASNSGYTYQWLRCDAAGLNCANIGGATSASYAVVLADVGSTLRTVVTASNTAGSTASAQSTQTGLVLASGIVTPPTSTSIPIISLPAGQTSPAPIVGSTLSVSLGTFSGSVPFTYTYQWKMCDAAGDPAFAPCYAIPGATSPAYFVTPSVFGKRLRAEVTARNSGGAASANSAATAVVTATAPAATATPQITGVNMVGEELELTAGTWTGTQPITFTRSWRRCDAAGTPASCVAIAGATGDTYAPVAADVGSTLRVWVTGVNTAGSAEAITNHTFPVVDAPHESPGIKTGPVISGLAVEGGTLRATMGEFTGDEPIATSVQWQRCDAVGITCRVALRKNRLAFTLTKADVGSTFRVVVTATNPSGETQATSDLTEPVLGMPGRVPGLTITGTSDLTFLLGTAYDDVITSGPGNVTIDGGGGYDTIKVGDGRVVVMVRGPGSSTVTAGKGSSTIYAANGYPDTVACSGSRDKVLADAIDTVTGCAAVTRSTQAVPRG